MGAFTSTEQKYHQLQANFHHCANALAELEFQIEFSHIEDGTPIPSSFPTPYTYWGIGRDNNTSTTPPPSSTPLPQGQIGEPPELLNISEELQQQLLCPITQEVMFDPWIDNEGNTYEYAAIMAHLTRSKTSPITRSPMFPTQQYLRPNRSLRDIIQLYTKPSSSPPLPLHTKKTA